MNDAGEPLDLPAIRERLTALEGRRFWKSLEELASTPAFEDILGSPFRAARVRTAETGFPELDGTILKSPCGSPLVRHRARRFRICRPSATAL